MDLDQYLGQLKKDRKELEKDWEPQAQKKSDIRFGTHGNR